MSNVQDDIRNVNEPLLHKNNPVIQVTSDVKDVKTNKLVKSVAITEGKNAKKNEKQWKMVPPDGGWGWLVLFGSTLVNLLVPGTVKSFGVLFVEFLEAFEATPSAAMWIPALCYFLYSSLGPISSILSVKYSYRTVTLIGGTFAATGMIISFFADSVSYLYISYGVFVGIGAGLSFPPTVYIVTSYFVRLRGVANGLCISGSALGSIILPPILRILLEYYGYRGAVLLMGGVTLNVWVAALFYDPVEKHMKKVPIITSSNTVGEVVVVETEEIPSKFIISQEDSMASLPQSDSFVIDNEMSVGSFNRSVSSATMQNLLSQKRERKISMPIGRNEVMKINKQCNNTGDSRTNMNSLSTLHAVPETQNGIFDTNASQNRMPSSSSATKRPKRSPSTSSFQYISTPYHGSTLTLQPEIFASSFSLRSNKNKQSDEQQKTTKLFDISLLKDPLYLIILLSNATNAISYTNFIILLPSYAQNLAFDKNRGALLLSIVSLLDLVGRIGGSTLSDLALCPKCWYFIGGLFISGVSLSIMPFFHEYWTISLFCAIFGLASGVYVGVTAVIMADMLGEERLQSTYGISLFVNGILQLIGPPICGIWFESTHSFTSLFCSLGVALIIGAVMWSFVPFIKSKTKNKDVQHSS